MGEEGRLNHSMLLLARESRGWSQTKLAKELGVSQGKLSKMENGTISVAEDLLTRISKKLEYPESFFCQTGAIHGAILSYNRKRMSLSKKILDQVRAQLNIRRLHIEKLLTSVDIESDQRWNIPQLDIDEFDGDVEEIARLVRAHWGVPTGPIDSVTALIEAGNSLVVECDLVSNKIDAEVHPFAAIGPLFFVNRTSPGDRLRFSLAHELGHVVMHKNMNPNVEAQADRFAAEFLMPEKDMKPYFRRRVTLETLAELKPIWKVSMAALLMRAAHLGYVTDRQRKYLWMQMSKLGYKTLEPESLQVERETPQKLVSLFQAHLDDLGYSEDELADLLCMTSEELFELYFPDKKQQASKQKLTLVKR